MHRRFAELSADLEQVTGDFPQKMLCPLCFTPMPEEWIDLEEPQITEEHIIPDMLGGTAVTLTCKRCNNTHGTELDSHLVQMIRFHDFLAGVGTKPVRGGIELDGKRFPSDIKFDSAENTVEFKMRRSHPTTPDAVRKFFQANPDTFKFHGSSGYIQYRADLALLRAGYLAMFKQWGYRYILSRAADVIRRTIGDYENPLDEVVKIILRNISPAPSAPLQLVRLQDGASILVVMTLVANAKPYYYGTPMPTTKVEPSEVFNILRQAAESLRVRRGQSR